MRHLLASLLIACFIGSVVPVRAQSGADPGDLFVNAYMAVQQADKAEQAGSFKSAMSKLRYAAEVLDTISAKYPSWSPPIVSYRKQRTVESMTRVQEKLAKFGPGKGGGDVMPGLDETPLPTNGNDAPLTFEQPGEGNDAPPPPPSPTPRVGKPRPAPRTDSSEDTTTGLVNAIDGVKKLQSELRSANAEIEKIKSEKTKIARELDDAAKAKESSEQKQKVLQTRADNAEAALSKVQTENKQDADKIRALQAEAADAKKQLRGVKINEEADAEVRQQLDDRLKAKQSEIARLTDRVAALDKANKEAPQKLQQLQSQLDKAMSDKAEVQAKLEKTQTQLATVTTQRDDAVKALSQLKEAAKNVDKLVSDNAALMAKLSEAEKSVANFKAEGEEKDKQIAALKTEVAGVKQQLAQAKKESADYQRQMGDLQSRLEDQSRQLAQAKSENSANAAERKKMQAENDILRGIVLRQQKQEAVRAATKKLVLGELAKLEINSKTLMSQIDFLSQPVVKLTAQEQKLFKTSVVQVSSEGEISANVTPKTDDAPPAIVPNPTMPEKTPEIAANPPVETPKAAAETTPPAEAPKPPLSLEPSAPKSEMDIAKLTTPEPKTTPKQDDLPSKGADEMPSTPGDTPAGTPNIPAEFLPLARDGKNLFEKGDYRGAEKIYEKILAKVPNNLYILSNLGVVRFRDGKYKQAEEVLLKATKVAPEDGFSHCTIGIVYYTEQKLDDAVNELTKALAINPKNATAHNYLGITAAGKGWQEAAQKELETATTLDPSYADAHFNLAVVFATQTPPNKDNARKYYKRATELGAEADVSLEQLLK